MPIFILAIAFDWAGALLALFVLKPLRIRWLPGATRLADVMPAGRGAAAR
jgi:hypothetical protein